MTDFPDGIQASSYLPLRLQVYTMLREAIIGGRLKPGERIVEDRICAELGVSRSPLREALRRLEGEGLVSILPRRGAVVSQFSPRDGLDLFAVREVLEGLAARQAARNRTEEELAELEKTCNAMSASLAARDIAQVVELNAHFHKLIARAGRNRWVREFLSSIRTQIRRIYRSSIEGPERGPDSVAEHRTILDALARRDPDAAERLAREHVRKARDAAISVGAAAPGD